MSAIQRTIEAIRQLVPNYQYTRINEKMVDDLDELAYLSGVWGRLNGKISCPYSANTRLAELWERGRFDVPAEHITIANKNRKNLAGQ